MEVDDLPQSSDSSQKRKAREVPLPSEYNTLRSNKQQKSMEEDPEMVVEFKPRPYQVDLFEEALAQNSIIYLPTGSGKTFIAVMLIKAMSGSIIKPYREGGKRTIFLVNTVPLVEQQSVYLAKHTGLTCRGFSGDQGVDFWSKEQWEIEFVENQILVFTAQIYLMLIAQGYLPLNRANLIIFDECHRGVGGHPMRQVMQTFDSVPLEQRPKVFGLSATLLNANVKESKIISTVRDLETTFASKVATVSSESVVASFSTNPKESFVCYDPKVLLKHEATVKAIMLKLSENINALSLKTTLEINLSSKVFLPDEMRKKLVRIIEDASEHYFTMGPYGGDLALLSHSIQLECLKQSLVDDNAIIAFNHMLTKFTLIRLMLNNEMKGYTESEKIFKFSSDRVRKMLCRLKNFYESEKEQKFCCIIFVRRRYTANVLYHLLKTLAAEHNDFKFLSVDYVVGFSNNPYRSSKESTCLARWNKKALQRFKHGEVNCIIATDVVDEGIDIPTCTLIIRYDLPYDFRSYIQSKGRARHSTSQYSIMVPKDDTDFPQRFDKFQSMERNLKHLLLGKTEFREMPTEEEMKEALFATDIAPFKTTNKDGVPTRITELTAIDLLNRYCASLFTSKFCTLPATWKLHQETSLKDGVMYQVSLQLPIVSPLKPKIIGDKMLAIDKAKRSVALKACVELYKMNEIGEDFLPKRVEKILEEHSSLFPNWIDEPKDEKNILGTNKNKRVFDIVHPQALYEAYPQPGKESYLHILHMKPNYPKSFDNRRQVFYNLFNADNHYAILSSKPMPQLPQIPMYMSSGEMSVDVKVNHSAPILSAEEIHKLKVFHALIFNCVDEVMKDFLVFDTENKENSFLIVPVNSESFIDWEMVQRYGHYPERVSPEKPIHVRHEDYHLALIIPSYRDAVGVYVVTDISEDLTPQSCFPSDDYRSFEAYYFDKHQLKVTNRDQPLIEVKAISKYPRCLKPRYTDPNSNKRKKSEKIDQYEEHLIPEFCKRIIFPSVYWLKATPLPAIIHRVKQLVVADEFRRMIVRETGMGVETLPVGTNWSPLLIKEERKDDPMDNLEANLDDTLGEIVISSDESLDVSTPEVDVLDMEQEKCSWNVREEPKNPFKDLRNVQVIDIEYFYQFIGSAEEEKKVQKSQLQRLIPPVKYVTAPKLDILTATNDRGPSPVLILQALTSNMANDAFNLERHETLGDAFLKFIASQYLFEKYPRYTEGQLTAIKGRIIGNRNLFYCGRKKKIPGRMGVEDFVANSNFVVPAFAVERKIQTVIKECNVSPNVLYKFQITAEERFEGVLHRDTWDDIEGKLCDFKEEDAHTGVDNFLGIQAVADKVVADSVEALIGVYLTEMGPSGATKLLTWLEVLPRDLNIVDLLSRTNYNPKLGDGNVNTHMPWADKIEQLMNYKFKNRHYLLQAFTHPSYSKNRLTACYERLEFLGDALLDFLITSYIYEKCGNLSPGELTDLRSALVNNITFACISVRLGFDLALLHYAPDLFNVIVRFVEFQIKRNYLVDDELFWILIEEEDTNIAEAVDVPKVLGDLFESMIGAIYLDSGKNIEVVWNIVYSILEFEIDKFSKKVPKQPIRVLYETQGASPTFHTGKIIGDTQRIMVPLDVTINGKRKKYHGFGGTKKQAKCAASKMALRHLRKQS